MDPLTNPFSPGSGHRPPALVGRDETLAQIKISLSRVKDGKAAKHFILVGLRGVGKTVLLREAKNIAERLNLRSVMFEAD